MFLWIQIVQQKVVGKYLTTAHLGAGQFGDVSKCILEDGGDDPEKGSIYLTLINAFTWNDEFTYDEFTWNVFVLSYNGLQKSKSWKPRWQKPWKMMISSSLKNLMLRSNKNVKKPKLEEVIFHFD